MDISCSQELPERGSLMTMYAVGDDSNDLTSMRAKIQRLITHWIIRLKNKIEILEQRADLTFVGFQGRN
jgi:hypothetical protein